jgi:DNA-binding beta-propeller fold protein YncE
MRAAEQTRSRETKGDTVRAAKSFIIAVGIVTLIFGRGGTALAVDAHKWVAALYIDAQKKVGLRWTPVPGATGYKVLRSATQGSGHTEIAAPATPQHFDGDLEPGTTYYYVLQAVAGAEASPNSPERSVIIPGVKKVEEVKPPEWDKIVPQSTTEFGKSQHKVGLFWKASRGKIAAYNVYRSEAAGKDYALVGSVTETQFVDATVEEAKTYYYVLSALDAATFMETPYSEEKSVTLEAVKRKKKVKKEKIIQHYRVVEPLWEVEKGDWGQINGPTDVALNEDDGELYIGNFGTRSIFVFSTRGEFLRSFGKQSPTNPKGLTDVKGLYFDEGDGLLYVGEPVGGRVVIFDPVEGKVVSDWRVLPEHGTVYPDESYKEVAKIPPGPVDICVHPDGDTLVVVENGRSKVMLYEKNGDFIKEISTGVGGGPPGLFSFPLRCKFNHNEGFENDVLVTDGFGARVQIYNFDTEEWRSFGERGEVAGLFKGIMDVHVAPGNLIFTSDKSNRTITQFDYEGVYQAMLGYNKLNPATNNYLMNFASPMGLTMDAAGEIAYITDYYGNALTAVRLTDEIFTPEGQ